MSKNINPPSKLMARHPLIALFTFELIKLRSRPWRVMIICIQPRIHALFYPTQRARMKRNILPYFENKRGICIGGALRWEFQEYLKSSEQIINVDCVKYFFGQPTNADYICDATDLYFAKDNEFDFVCSSHVLEHLTNPIKALEEWIRVVKKGGSIYCGVPDKRLTFDHRRKRTTLLHLIDDHVSDIGPLDTTHLCDILYNSDLSLDSINREQAFKRMLEYVLAGGVQTSQPHHHVFIKQDLIALFNYVGLEMIFATLIGDTIHVVGRKSDFASSDKLPRH